MINYRETLTDVTGPCSVIVQAAARSTSLFFHFKLYFNKHSWISEGMIKVTVQLTEIHVLSHVNTQSVFLLQKNVNRTACEQYIT